MKHWITVLLISCVALSLTPSYAASNDRKLKLAESYAKSRDYDNAMRLYSELYDSDPSDKQYFAGYVAVLQDMQNFPVLVEVLTKSSFTNTSAELTGLLACASFRNGDAQQASQAFEKSINLANSTQTWTQVAQLYIQYRMFDKAIATLLAARDSQQSDAFANELCQLYTSEGQYSNACEEVINMLSQNIDPGVVRGRLSAIASTEKGKTICLEFLEQRVRNSARDMRILSLYEWFLREIGEWDKAWTIVQQMYELSDKDMRKALQFANAAKNAGSLQSALSAFEYIISNASKKDPNIHSALYNYARTMELVLNSKDALTQDQVDRTVQLYDEIIDRFPKNKLAYDARVRKALIVNTYRGQTQAAIEILSETARTANRFASGGEAALLLFDIYFASEDYTAARETLKSYLPSYSKFGELKSKFVLRQAHVLLANQEYDSASNVLQTISAQEDSPEANDALRILTLLQENPPEEHKEGLQWYFAAQRAELRNDTTTALDNYKRVQQASRYSVLSQRSYLRSIQLTIESGNIPDALSEIDAYLEAFEPGVFTDNVLWLQGHCFEQMGDTEAALQVYTTILRDHPRSPFKRDARERINSLRSS